MLIFELDLLELVLKLHQLLGILSLLSCFLLNRFDFLSQLLGQINENMSVNASQNLCDQFITSLAKLIVDIAALDKEHVHSDLEGHLITDSLNHVVILIDLRLELITIKWLLLQELFDALLLVQEEQEIIIDMEGFLDNLQVLSNSFRDFRLGNVYDLVISWNVPKMLLVTALNSIFRPRQVPTLKNNVVYDNFELVLNL